MEQYEAKILSVACGAIIEGVIGTRDSIPASMPWLRGAEAAVRALVAASGGWDCPRCGITWHDRLGSGIRADAEDVTVCSGCSDGHVIVNPKRKP
jgi:hypothetical protein